MKLVRILFAVVVVSASSAGFFLYQPETALEARGREQVLKGSRYAFPVPEAEPAPRAPRGIAENEYVRGAIGAAVGWTVKEILEATFSKIRKYAKLV